MRSLSPIGWHLLLALLLTEKELLISAFRHLHALHCPVIENDSPDDGWRLEVATAQASSAKGLLVFHLRPQLVLGPHPGHVVRFPLKQGWLWSPVSEGRVGLTISLSWLMVTFSMESRCLYLSLVIESTRLYISLIFIYFILIN